MHAASNADGQCDERSNAAVSLMGQLFRIILGKLMSVQLFQFSTLFPTVMAEGIVEIPVSVNVKARNPMNTFPGAMVGVHDICTYP